MDAKRIIEHYHNALSITKSNDDAIVFIWSLAKQEVFDDIDNLKKRHLEGEVKE